MVFVPAQKLSGIVWTPIHLRHQRRSLILYGFRAGAIGIWYSVKVVVQLYLSFKFSFLLFLGMVMYDNNMIMSLKQKKGEFEPRIKLNHNMNTYPLKTSIIMCSALRSNSTSLNGSHNWLWKQQDNHTNNNPSPQHKTQYCFRWPRKLEVLVRYWTTLALVPSNFNSYTKLKRFCHFLLSFSLVI